MGHYSRPGVLALLILAAAIGPTKAQLSLPPTVPCQAFQRTPEGMWRVVQPVTIASPQGASVSLGPGAAFGPGVSFAGINLWQLLEQQCR
jgi:hypothetical protein